jgi:hypothetical protein
VFLCLLILFSAASLFAITSHYTLRLKTPNLEVYAESPINAAQSATFARVDNKIDDMQMELGIYVDRPASIYLVKDHASYQRLALGKAHIVEFSDAFYSGGEQKIYIRPQAEVVDNYIKVILHEYIHWYLETIFEHTPLWFHEGMATQYSGQMGFERYVYFLQQSFLGQHSDLFRMSYAYPAKKEDWQIFYLSSSMAVRFMRDRKPNEWKRFWDTVAANKRNGHRAVFSECFAFSYRTTMYDFHQQFATYTKSLRYQYLFWGFNSLLALLLPFVLIIGYSIRRKRMSRLPDLPEVEEEPEEMDSI